MSTQHDAPDRDTLIALFTHYAQAIGAQVQVIDRALEAAPLIATAQQGRLQCTAAVREQYPQLYAVLGQEGMAVLVAEDVAATIPDRADIAPTLAGGTGLVLARAGVAETGSLLQAGDALAPRLLWMLSDICVALLPAGAILPDLDAMGRLLADLERQGARYLSLVTGPSRTADVEMVLTVGVQGPKALHIIVVRNEDEGLGAGGSGLGANLSF